MITGTYDTGLVALSFAVAVLASYTALELSRRVATTSGRAATIWLVTGAFSMGTGIWSMHFVGMLAFSMAMPFSYDVPVTALSLLVGVVASAFAIFVASREHNSALIVGASGLILGGGIAAMHYTGMAAMRMPATIVYDPMLVGASVVIAVVAACAAIWIAFKLARFSDRYVAWYRFGAAIIMGIAICGMHYTGMLAATYEPDTGAMLATMPSGGENNEWIAVGVALSTLVILGITHLTIFFDLRLGHERRLGEQLSDKVQQQFADLERRQSELDRETEHRRRVENRALQLTRILDESASEIYLFDATNLRFLQVNHGALENLGYTREQLLTMTPVDLKPDYDYSGFVALTEPLRLGRERHLVFETTHRRADGSTYPVEVNLQYSSTDERPVFMAIIQDITERKNLETQLVQSQKLESIGQLAAGIAHEINTPTQFVGDNTRFLKDGFEDLMSMHATFEELLAAVKSNSITPELVAAVDRAVGDADAEYLKEEMPAAIAQTLDGIDRIANIVRAMKEFSHPGGKEMEEVDLNRAIANTVTVASNEWKYVADLETNFDPALPVVPCLPQEINQVLLNLIVNASHAIADKLRQTGEEKGKIDIATRAVDGVVEIRVTDTGGGIPAQIIDRVFDPFFTTKEVGKGTGQGLAIARSAIVNKHGGAIDVTSTPGVGSTFLIKLPLARERGDTVAA